uniref:DNA helicase Pif1-like 2B domain-containing protein n=1 Tax=Glycine max TaxID=3847 RepID=A0A0R0FEF0_SOYBN
MFFLYNYSGSGKTLMWKTLTLTLRRQTAHSKFKIHVSTFDDSICNIHQGSELAELLKWILDIGDGKISEPNDGYAIIEISQELLILDFNGPIQGIYLQCRAILASTIDTVDEINDFFLSLVPGGEKEYLSLDMIYKSNAADNQAWKALTPKFLNSLGTSGLPNHKIKLKVGSLIMLLRNIDQSEGLCNGTRLRQFPIMLSYAMTINKSQDQSLECVELYLPRPVFSHGQLYVAVSRVKSKQGLKILIHDKEGRPLNTTTNVVFKEVFRNL